MQDSFVPQVLVVHRGEDVIEEDVEPDDLLVDGNGSAARQALCMM